MTQYKTQYGTVFAVKEHNGSPAIMCRAEVSETWSLSSMILLRTQLKQAQLSPTAYGKVVAHVLQVARTLLDTVRVCAPDGYDMDSEEDDDFE